MKNIKETLTKITSSLIIVTYMALLFLIITNLNNIRLFISSFINLISPFIYALVIAYILNIPMTKIDKFLDQKLSIKFKKYSRPIAILLAIILAFFILSMIVSFIAPQLAASISNLILNLENYSKALVDTINSLIEFFNLGDNFDKLDQNSLKLFFENLGVDWNSLMNTASTWITNTGAGLIDYVAGFAIVITNLVIGFFFAIYLLSSKETFIRQSKKVFAASLGYKLSNKVLDKLNIVNNIFKNFVGGQLVEAIIIGILIYISLVVTKMPYAVLISSIVAVMALVPVFGAMLAMMFGFILILSIDPIKSIWFIVVFQIVQTFENNVIYPKVVGESVGLPAIWTLLSIIVFGGYFGVFGMLVAVPLTASIYVIGSAQINKVLTRKKIIVNESIELIKEEVVE